MTKWQNTAREGVTVACDDTKAELAISQGFTFTEFLEPFPDSWAGRVSTRCEACSQAASPCLLSSPSDISYSQGNSAPGIRAYSIVHRQLPLLVFRGAPGKGPTVRFSGETRGVLTRPVCPVWWHVGSNPSASKMLPVTRSFVWMPRGGHASLGPCSPLGFPGMSLSRGCRFRHAFFFFIFSYFPLYPSKIFNTHPGQS